MGTMITASNTGDREAAENMLEYVGTDKNAAGGLEVGGSRLAWPDLLVIAAYFVFVLTVGLWVSWSFAAQATKLNCVLMSF